MQVNLRSRGGTAYGHLRQATLAFDDLCDTSDFKPTIQLGNQSST
jgi:hypothetical protein